MTTHIPVHDDVKKKTAHFGLLYDMAFWVFGILYLPFFMRRLNQAENGGGDLISRRFGSLPEAVRLQGKKVTWVHAVSVGEVMAIRKWVEQFLQECPGQYLLITTVTPTGQKIAKTFEQERVLVTYVPFDLGFAVNRFLKAVKPERLLLVETELWPNLIFKAAKQNVRVGLINGRLSARSSGRYRKIRGLIKPVLECLDFALVQTQEDAVRFFEIGIPKYKIHVMGNMKYDNTVLESSTQEDVQKLKQQWGFQPQDILWIAGSTHPGEEEILMRVFTKIKNTVSNLKLIIAPRHIERSEEIVQRISAIGVSVQLSDQMNLNLQKEVLVLNRMGILKNLYQMADIVFVGGSLIHHGGQNPIEAAVFQKAVLHGPHVFNFEKVYQELKENGAALLVKDEEELLLQVRRLLEHESERRQMGSRAFETIHRLQGATERHLQWLLKEAASVSERISHVEYDEKLFPASGRRP